MRTLRSAAKQGGWAWVPWAISAVAGAIAADKQRKATNEANDTSIELANTALQRKAADARAAGLHPLAALGASGSNVPAIAVQDYGWINNLGQDLSRAFQAGMSSPERGQATADGVIAKMRETERSTIGQIDQANRVAKVDAQNDALFAQRLEKGNLELELMRQQIFRNNLPGQLPPPRPYGGPNAPGDIPDASVGAVKTKPAEVISKAPGDPSTEAGKHAAWRRIETAPGVFRWIPSPELNLDSELAHALIAGQMYWDRWNWRPLDLPKRDYEWSRQRFNFGRGAPMYGPLRPNRKGL